MPEKNDSTKPELLPCPFCGGKINDALIHIGHSDDCVFLAVINKDHTRDRDWWDGAWNTRA